MSTVELKSCKVHGTYLEWDGSPVPAPTKNGLLSTYCPGCWQQVAETTIERDERKRLYDEAVTTLVEKTKKERRSAQIEIVRDAVPSHVNDKDQTEREPNTMRIGHTGRFAGALAGLALSGLSLPALAHLQTDSEASQEDAPMIRIQSGKTLSGHTAYMKDAIITQTKDGVTTKTGEGYLQELKASIAKKPPLNRAEHRRRVKDQQRHARLMQKNKQKEEKT